MDNKETLFEGIVFFTEVIRCGSFTAAAEKSGHSTSFMSKQIAKLEQRLGTRLMNRTTRSIGLTPEGQAYYERCEQLVADAEAATALLTSHHEAPRGKLKLSCPTSFGLTHLRPILGEFLQQHPGVTLELDINDRRVDIISEGYDIAIRATGQLEDSSLISRRIVQSHGVTVASPDYLRRHGTPRHPADLAAHQCIQYSLIPTPHLWRFEHHSGEVVEVETSQRVLCNSGSMNLAMAIAGQGITAIPAFNLTDELQQGRLLRILPEWEKKPINIYLVYPSKRHMSPRVRAFIDFLTDRIPAQITLPVEPQPEPKTD